MIPRLLFWKFMEANMSTFHVFDNNIYIYIALSATFSFCLYMPESARTALSHVLYETYTF